MTTDDTDAEIDQEIPTALAESIASWRRMPWQRNGADHRQLLRRAAGDLKRSLAVNKNVYPASHGVAHVAVMDALADFAILGEIPIDDGQGIIAAAFASDGDGDAGARAELHIIQIEGGKRHEAVSQAQAAILESEAPVFHRAGALVEPASRYERSPVTGKLTTVSVCRRYTEATLAHMIAQGAAAFQAQNRRGDWVAVDPPPKVVEALLELAHSSAFPTLVGIINTPTMRPDGTLLTKPGFDAATGLWYAPAGDVALPEIPECPTREDAQEALEFLKGELVGFPFASTLDRAVALAAIQTVVLRGAFPVAPMYVIAAPEAGTGKSYFVIVVATIALGRNIPAIVGSRNFEEMEKRLGAAAFEGVPILSLNNLDFDLDSATLCQMITDGVIGIRVLGKSELLKCDCRATTIFANGQNLRVKGDLVRRTLTVQLDAKLERPETRQFPFDPIERIRADRGRYIAAAFIIARAYRAAGYPDVEALPLNGFEGWTRVVRLPLLWLGEPDPAATIEEARRLDPDRENLRGLIEAIRKHIGVDKEFTAADCERLAGELGHDLAGRSVYARPDFRGQMTVGGKVSVKSIGRMLMRYRDRRVGEFLIEIAVQSDKTANSYRLAGPPGSAAVAAADRDYEF